MVSHGRKILDLGRSPAAVRDTGCNGDPWSGVHVKFSNSKVWLNHLFVFFLLHIKTKE